MVVYKVDRLGRLLMNFAQIMRVPTLKAVEQRGWCNKRGTTKTGVEKGGRAFDKGSLYKLLTSRTYAGVVSYGGQDYPGEHAAMVEPAVWERARAILARNGHTKGAAVRNRYGALLVGLVHCGCSRCAMVHSYSVNRKPGAKRYRYHVCLAAQKRGWDACPSKSVPAGQLEQFVVEQIKRIGQDPAVLAGTLRQIGLQQQRALADLTASGEGGGAGTEPAARSAADAHHATHA